MKIAIRVDASLQMGTGHLMRCLTLADAARRAGTRIRFVSRALAPHLAAMLAERGYELAALAAAPARAHDGAEAGTAHAHWLGAGIADDAAATSAALADAQWDWLVVDHYGLDARWETALRARARRLLVIDDLADRRHDCDVLLDQNAYADAATRYTALVPPHATLLLGPAHALLRAEFAQARAALAPRAGAVRRLLVFIGGADADNVTAGVLDVLARVAPPGLAVDVVLGAAHPQRAALEQACALAGWNCHVQSRDMAGLMARADLAIGAGGSATWERCCLGLPALTLCIAANQRQLVDDAAAAGLIYAPALATGDAAGLERHLLALLDNPGLRLHLARQGWAAVDGQGAARVAGALLAGALTMRPASAADSAQLFEWRNHAAVRAVSRQRDPIGAAEHAAWLAAVLADPARVLLIGLRGDAPVGVVRYDLAGSQAEVSIYLLAACMGQGLGGPLLAAAEAWLRVQRPAVRSIVAEVLPGNVASQRLFERAGFSGQTTHYLKKVHHD